MTKKATRLATSLKRAELNTKQPRTRLAEGVSKSVEGDPSGIGSPLAEGTQAFSSEEEVLNLLITNIADKLGSAGGDRAQMHEFLKLVLDTDPTLKEEILEGLPIRK